MCGIIVYKEFSLCLRIGEIMFVKIFRVISLVFLCLVLIGCSKHDREAQIIYVDSSSDSLNVIGSIDEPVKSLEQLNDIVLVPGDQVLFKKGTSYRGQLFPRSGSKDADIIYSTYGEGSRPMIYGSIEGNEVDDWILDQNNIYKFKYLANWDIGNVIFNNGEAFGVKKWSLGELSSNGDYYFDMKSKELFMYMDRHPSDKYLDIECALTQHIIDESNVSYVTYEGLELKYGGAHGIGGGNVSHITIQNLKICYMGGGYLYMEGDEFIQYGNGIEFWSDARDLLVENCEIFEIFDSGVTNQNNTKKANQERITYRNNTIYNCGMASFEIDNGPKQGNTEDIVFENNVCSNVGMGWGMTQDRYENPELNIGLGHHIAIFYIETPLKNLSIINNTFENAYHPNGYGSVFIYMNIAREQLNELTFRENNIIGSFDSLGYTVEDGELLPVDEF